MRHPKRARVKLAGRAAAISFWSMFQIDAIKGGRLQHYLKTSDIIARMTHVEHITAVRKGYSEHRGVPTYFTVYVDFCSAEAFRGALDVEETAGALQESLDALRNGNGTLAVKAAAEALARLVLFQL